MTDGDMFRGVIIGITGVLLFVVGASTIATIWWVGVCFVVAAMACMGFGVFVVAMSNEKMPTLRGF
jgi:uncharacterized membrane protein YccF (DUF307 family)